MDNYLDILLITASRYKSVDAPIHEYLEFRGNGVARVVDKLLQDHKNIITLLALMEKQVQHFVAGEYVDYQILSDIMHYFVNQPDVYHHPHEDIIFAALKLKDINVADLIEEISAEHDLMAKASSTINDELKLIQGNAIFSRQEIVRQLKDFIKRYHDHIIKEEQGLFALANSSLDAADWRRVEHEIEHNEDPLFGNTLRDEYQALYKAILSEDKESLPADPRNGA